MTDTILADTILAFIKRQGGGVSFAELSQRVKGVKGEQGYSLSRDGVDLNIWFWPALSGEAIAAIDALGIAHKIHMSPSSIFVYAYDGDVPANADRRADQDLRKTALAANGAASRPSRPTSAIKARASPAMIRSSTTTRPLSPEIRERLGKLLPRLASVFDGERTATLATIERVLKSGGLDWHDFTGAITGAAPPPPPPPPPEYSARTSTWERDEDGINTRSEDVRDTVNAIRAKRRFGTRAEEFLDDLMDRADRYDEVYFSPKQWNFLRSLARQAGLRGAQGR